VLISHTDLYAAAFRITRLRLLRVRLSALARSTVHMITAVKRLRDTIITVRK
jgi:hypothetical protein